MYAWFFVGAYNHNMSGKTLCLLLKLCVLSSKSACKRIMFLLVIETSWRTGLLIQCIGRYPGLFDSGLVNVRYCESIDLS